MPDPAPLFSVVIPAYNREKLVGAALCSVAGQTFKDWECIVVDDGSTDGTGVSVKLIAGILQGLAKKENTKVPDIRLIRVKNGGPGAARNAGAAQAKGKYLAFLDSDDVWMLWTLETYRDALEKAGWPTLLMARVQDFVNDGELPNRPQAPRFRTYPDALAAGVAGHTPGAGMSVVQAEAFRTAGGYWSDRINAEDHDLALRLGGAPGFVAVEDPVTLGYRRHGVQETEASERTVAGMERLVAREKADWYPGGPARARERRAIVCAHVRPVCVSCLKAGQRRPAWRLYRATLGWQLAAGRWKFAVGFPLKAAQVEALRFVHNASRAWTHGTVRP